MKTTNHTSQPLLDFAKRDVADSPPSALDRFRPYNSRDISAYSMFDAAYPTPTNIQHWGHLRPETPEDILRPYRA